jgi:hypothetical protein
LFNKKGLLTALMPGLKGYQAGGKSAEKLKGGGESGGLGAGAESILNTVADRLTQLKSQFRMVAKNSLVLPQMARDTNITRQNIQKLVKLQGGDASNKADMFFKRSAERESQYENAMKEGKPTSAKEDGKKEDDKEGFFKKIFKFIMPIVGILVKAIKSVAASIVNAIKGIVEFTKNIPALTNGLGALVRFLAPGGALLLGLSALGAAISAIFSGPLERIYKQGTAIVWSIVGWGAAITAFGLTKNLYLALFFLAVAGAADNISAIFRTTMMQVVIPDEYRGRLQGLFTVVVAGGPRLGDFESGTVAAIGGEQLSVVSGGIACVACTYALVKWHKPFMQYDSREPVA